METLLIDDWTPEADAIPVIDEASVSVARQRAREVARAKGMSTQDAEHLALIASELGMNQLRHASFGRIAIRSDERGVEIVAADRGPGIANIPAALSGIPRTSGSLGVGLASVREHADEVDFDVRLLEGTCIKARKLVVGALPGREVGIFGRPFPGETRSGDHAAVRRAANILDVGICDGLGHGVLARQASSVAVTVFLRENNGSPAEMLDACHRAAVPTRGGVMAVARLDDESKKIDVASVGNITVEIIAPRIVNRFVGASSVLGSPSRQHKVAIESRPFAETDTLVLFTDGLGTRLAIEDDLMLLREHPIVIAHQLIERFARDNDDALVVVVR